MSAKMKMRTYMRSRFCGSISSFVLIPYGCIKSDTIFYNRNFNSTVFPLRSLIWEKLFDHANAPIVVWDRDLMITRFNHAFEELTGIPEEEAICSHLGILFPDSSRDSSLAMVDRAMAQEKLKGVEIPIYTRTGNPRTILWNSANIMGNDGKSVVATVAHGQDITERKEAEESYQALFSEMQDGFALHELIYDDGGRPVDFRFLAVNRAFEAMMGLEADDIIGKTTCEVLPTTKRHYIDIYGDAVLAGIPALFENYSAILDKHFLIRLFSPAKRQCACILTDITEKEKAEEVWRLAFSQIEENMYRLSILNDQVRNPLAVITGLIDLHGGEYADKIIREVKEIDRIITLLDQGVLESEAIREYMRKHNQIGENF